MPHKLLATSDDGTLVLLRIVLGVVMFPHGAQKVLGWFGGYGFSGTMSYFTDNVGLPWIVALLVVAAEFLGSIGLLVGALTRVAAFGIGAVMIGALFIHFENGFFMNWSGTQAGEGFEYHLLAIAIAAVLTIGGGGPFSIDRRLAKG